jgi:hypothetical protein
LSRGKIPKESWMETRPYPGSRYQPLVSTALLLVSLAVFLVFAKGNIAVQALLLLVFASLTFSVAIFPQHNEFTRMADVVVKDGLAKARVTKGVNKYTPLLSLLVVLVIAPLLILFIAPPELVLGSLMGIIAGFAGFQLAFTLYVRNWERTHGIKVCRYSLVSEDEHGKRVTHEYGLKAERG